MDQTTGLRINRLIEIPAGPVHLEGSLQVPIEAEWVVIFAHGSGSSRHSPRNRAVAEHLRQGNLGTLLMDLLTQTEEAEDLRTRHLRFDIDLPADRLIYATEHLTRRKDTNALTVGYFGTSTGGGAALVAAAALGSRVGAVVSRGGRPDLAGAALKKVHAPTLLIVGERDEPVIEMNREAMVEMQSEVTLQIIPNATHLFPEPGALELVAELATDWFNHHLANSGSHMVT